MDPLAADAPMSTTDTADRLSLGDLLSRLVEEMRAWFNAEFALYRAEATRRGLSAGIAAAFIFGALTLAQAALVTLLVGLVLLLSPMIGIGLAILAVVGTTLLLVAVLVWLGKQRIEAIIDPNGQS